MSLFDGVNVITVTATDASLKTGNDTLTVTFDNTPPTVEITGPTADPTYITNLPVLTLTGTADDSETSVVSVTWVRTEDGANGTAAGTVSWTAACVVSSSLRFFSTSCCLANRPSRSYEGISHSTSSAASMPHVAQLNDRG